MPLNVPVMPELPPAARYLLPGLVAGGVGFAFSRVVIEPLVARAVDYEARREHAEAQLLGAGGVHGPELFTRAVQENVGAAVGIVTFGLVMGVLFAVAYTVLRSVLVRRGLRCDPTGLALLLAAGMFVATAVVPALKYPANPPSVGLPDTAGARTSAFLTITVVSVVGAAVAVAAGLAWSRRWGRWPATLLAGAGYLAATVVAMLLLPNVDEVPGPLTGSGGLVLDGFPAQVLAQFRLASLTNLALMWLAIGTTFGLLVTQRKIIDARAAVR